MGCRVLASLGLVLLVVPASSIFPDMAPIHSKCFSLLAGLSNSRYSTQELALLCRSRLPIDVCRAEARDLGEKPWRPSTIGRVCGKWEEEWTDRALKMTQEERMLEYADFQAQVDDIMKQKAAVGLCVNQTVDQCAIYKREEYPKYAQQLNDAYREKRETGKDYGQAARETLGITKEDTREGSHETVEAATAELRLLEQPHSEPTMSRPTAFALAAAVAATLGVAIAAVAFFVLRGRRRRADDEEEESEEEESDAELPSQSAAQPRHAAHTSPGLTPSPGEEPKGPLMQSMHVLN